MDEVPVSETEPGWRSKIYPRYCLTTYELTRLAERYLSTGYMTTEDLNHELRKSEHWLRDNPGRARHKRDWYRFANNWIAKEEDKARNRKLRGSVGGINEQRYTGAVDRISRRRSLGLEEEEPGSTQLV